MLDLLFTPFLDYAFMRRALAACAAIAMSGAPLGVFLVLRRMTLVGDAISHAVLPGVALAFLYAGLSLPLMTLGGLGAGLLIALIAGLITRFTPLKEDASFTGTYLLSLAGGVLVISLKGSAVDLMHVLFGNVLAIDRDSLLLLAGVSTFSLLALAFFYRSLVVACFDAGFLTTASRFSVAVAPSFLILVVLNLVAAFQALGTLMALGIMVLPAISARFWAESLEGTLLFSIIGSFLSAFAGLLISYYYNAPSGPAIVLTAGVLYGASILIGRHGSIRMHFMRRRHFTQ